jgi:hypothetical protein
VPYPSAFHWHEEIATLPWAVQPDPSARPVLAFFMGSLKTASAAANGFRRALHAQCRAAEAREAGTCVWHDMAHDCLGVLNATAKLRLFRRAKFCLAPPGDTVTRKSLFDSLTAGCVPVIFARASLAQYSWHLSAAQIREVAILIPAGEVLSGATDVFATLAAVSPAQLRRMQQSIAAIAGTLQYSLAPRHIRAVVNTSAALGASTAYSADKELMWESPVRDACDVIVDRLLAPSTIAPLQGFAVEERRNHKCLQHALIAQHPDYGQYFGEINTCLIVLTLQYHIMRYEQTHF